MNYFQILRSVDGREADHLCSPNNGKGQESALRRWISGALCIAWLVPLQMHGQDPVPVGPEFAINNYTTGSNSYPDVTRLAGGDFVVVWQSNFDVGGSYPDSNIRSQRISSDGTLLGPDTVISTATTGQRVLPRVVPHPDGGFLAGWTSPDGGFVTFGTDQGAFLRRFEADGTPLGDEFQVNTYTPYYQVFGDVAITPDGDFLVVWDSLGGFGDDPGQSIQARKYSSDGLPQGEQFQVNTYTTGFQAASRVVHTPDVGFMVFWRGTGTSDGISFRRVNESGVPLGDQVLLNDFSPLNPDVSAASDGSFVVVWARPTGFYDRVEGRRFDAMGQPLGELLVIRESTTGSLRDPVVEHWDNGEFLVVWSAFEPDASEPTWIENRRFTAEGAFLGDVRRITAPTPTGSRTRPRVTADEDGRILATWNLLTMTPPSEGITDIDPHGRFIEVSLFADGFESGQTAAWSNVSP